MRRLFYNMLIGALVLVIHFRETLGVAQALDVSGGQWIQPNTYYTNSRHLVKTVNGHLISLSTDDEGDVSMEVIGIVPNQLNVQSQPPPAQFREANSFFPDAGMAQMTAEARSNPMSNIAGTAGTNFASPPGMNQFVGANVQTQTGSSGFGAAATSFGVSGSLPSNPNFQQQPSPPSQQQPNGPPFGNQPNSQTGDIGGPVNFPVNPPTPSQIGGEQNPMSGVAGNSNFQQPLNGPPFMNSPAVNGGPVNPQVPSQFGGSQNTVGGIVPSVSSGIDLLLRDSDEFHDVSVERDLILGQNGQLQSRVTVSRDSEEYDDTSLEVNLNLLPRIRTLLNSQHFTHQQQVNTNPRMVFFQHDDQENDLSLEYQDILASPVFQQQIQEIDVRLKRAPAARSKRLMEKYAEALALSTSTAPSATQMNSSPFYLSLLITWISVWLIL